MSKADEIDFAELYASGSKLRIQVDCPPEAFTIHGRGIFASMRPGIEQAAREAGYEPRRVTFSQNAAAGCCEITAEIVPISCIVEDASEAENIGESSDGNQG